MLTSCLAAGPWAGTCGCSTDRPCNKSSAYHAVTAALGPGWWQHPYLFLVVCVVLLNPGSTCDPTETGPEVHKWFWKSWESPAQSMCWGTMLFCTAELFPHRLLCSSGGGRVSSCWRTCSLQVVSAKCCGMWAGEQEQQWERLLKGQNCSRCTQDMTVAIKARNKCIRNKDRELGSTKERPKKLCFVRQS